MSIIPTALMARTTPLRYVDCPQEVHIDHEMEVNQGSTLWDGRTEFSYSPDSRRTLTLASSLKDVSEAYRSVGGPSAVASSRAWSSFSFVVGRVDVEG